MIADFEMTDADLKELMEAMQPVPYVAIHCGPVRGPQERANDAWKALGERMGFEYMTARPNGKGLKCFSAVKTQTH